MTASKSLPARPSLESLRKQAKKLARDIAAGAAGAIARARAQLPNVELPLTQRNAQLVIAREDGYPGWQALTTEVSKRLGNSLEWAVAQARRVIHDNDVERLKQLLAEYPALLSWRNDWDSKGGLLGFATDAYGDAGDAQREQWFTRGACAELLIDAGAVVMPSVCEGLLRSRARGLEQFQRKGLLPRTLKFFAALGDLEAFAPLSMRTGTIFRPSMKRSSALATSNTRPSRYICWNDRSLSIPSSASTSREAPTAFSHQGFREIKTLRRSPSSECGRCSSSSSSGARFKTRMCRHSAAVYSVSRGCSATPTWRFRPNSSKPQVF